MPLYHPFLNFVKSIRLPEYSYVGITGIEKNLIDTSYFQRLRRIKQSSSLYMAFPGASHSRFEHSLGSMHIAGEATTYLLLNSNHKFNTTSIMDLVDSIESKLDFKRQIQIARLAALLHDIGHAPFSHTFEEFLRLGNPTLVWRHEFLTLEIIYNKLSTIIKQDFEFLIQPYEVISLLCDITNELKLTDQMRIVLKNIGVPNDIISEMEIFLNSHWYLNHIIKGDPYNADRFNYLILDSNRSGAKEYGYVDIGRIIQNLYYLPDKHLVTVSTHSKETALRFFEAYSNMHNSIYLHKVSQGADIHLSYIMKEASNENQSIFHSLLNPTMDKILELSDDILLYELNKVENEKTKKLVNDYLNRNIFTLVHEFDPTDNNRLTRIMDSKGSNGLQDEIRKEAGLYYDRVIIVIKTANKKVTKPPVDEFTLKKLAFYNVELERLEPVDIDLSRQFSPTKKYRIYCEKEDKEKIRNVIKGWII